VRSAAEKDWDQPAEQALPRLVDLYGGALYGLGRRLCGCGTDAEDMVQETFLRAFRDWHQFEGRAEPKSWLFTIAARVCQRQQRRRAGEPPQVASLDEPSPFEVPTLGTLPRDVEAAERERVRRDAQESLGASLAALPEEFRLPLVLKEVIGFSLEEVAGILGLKTATVKTRVHRGRMRLRRAIDDALPQRQVPPASYDRQVCLDLLLAKQNAIDGGGDFPNASEIICERCRIVFDELDLAHDLCLEFGEGELPGDLRRRLLAQF